MFLDDSASGRSEMHMIHTIYCGEIVVLLNIRQTLTLFLSETGYKSLEASPQQNKKIKHTFTIKSISIIIIIIITSLLITLNKTYLIYLHWWNLRSWHLPASHISLSLRVQPLSTSWPLKEKWLLLPIIKATCGLSLSQMSLCGSCYWMYGTILANP